MSSDESRKNQSTKSHQKENGAYSVRPLPLVAPVCPIRWRDVVVHLLISALAGATHTNQIANAATKHDAVIAVR